MKVFALTFLCDLLKEKFKEFDDLQLDCINILGLIFNIIGFAGHVAYVISRELDLADLRGKSFLAMA